MADFVVGYGHWMADGVAVLENGSVVRGSYDGYGRFDGIDVLPDHRAVLWHRACWDLSGQPTTFDADLLNGGDSVAVTIEDGQTIHCAVQGAFADDGYVTDQPPVSA